jgi:hypothetical protein
MNRKITALILSAALMAGCGGSDSNQGPLKIDRGFVKVHEDGLGTIRLFQLREVGDGLWAKRQIYLPSHMIRKKCIGSNEPLRAFSKRRLSPSV